ncbi:MAG TPA: hypothetical protein VGN26_07440 [Armatimonadota bacterium]
MKQALGYSLAVFVAALVQSAVVPEFVPHAWAPDLLLLTSCVGAWSTTAETGAALGLWGGLLTAVLSDGYMGSFTFSRLVAAYLVGRLREEVYGDSPVILVALIPLACLSADAVFLLFNPRHYSGYGVLLRQAAATAIAVPLVWFLLKPLTKDRGLL